ACLSTLPRMAVTGAITASCSRISGAPTSPAWMMCRDPRNAVRASGRRRPWVSEMTPMMMGVLGLSVSTCRLRLHLFGELANADDGPAHGAASDLLRIVASAHPQGVKPPIEGFEFRHGLDASADSAGSAMLDMDRRPYRDFVAFAVRLQSAERRRFHQPDHIRGGIDRRQLPMMRGQSVLELDRFLRFSARCDRNLSGQNSSLSKKEMSQ